MRLLLDTHVALWTVTDEALPPAARALLQAGTHEVFVSVVSLWEIAIKHGLRRGGRGDMRLSAPDARDYFEQAGMRLLAATPAHAIAVEGLPRLHGDPFDRLLLAQAITEPMRLVTHDAILARYDPSVMRV